MSKAVQGAAMLAGAVAMGTAAFFDPALIASPLYDKIMFGLALGGISMEAGAIAGALTSNRGQNITTRQAASYRQIIYGTQRVGGVEIYRSTTGSHKDQFNYVIVLATHECWAIESLYLDGRKVYFNTSSGGNSTRNGINFGGSADGGTYTGPNGQQYNFGTLVYCEAYYGDQTSASNTVPGGGFSTGLQANDGTWSPTSSGTPYVAGCTYVYLKVEHDTAMFPGEPEIRFTVHGKPVYDPRTGTTAYSSNWALIVNDVLTDPDYGVGDPSVNQEQLIAAANVCDEQVALAAGGTESRYSCHYHYDTSVGVGDVLSTMMSAAAGRLSRIGGEWYIWPAYFQGATASFGAGDLTGAMHWTPTRSFRELFNRVTGTYIAPNYPFNVAGNLYDSNGWYDGQIQNNFPFAFQPTNYPQYGADVLHGYASDEYLDEDGGIPLPKEIGQQCVLSVAQAQRVAKIYLLRNRQQGMGTFQMSLNAFQLQPCDTFNMTFAQNGWADKLLEVNSVSFSLDKGSQGQAPQIVLQVGVNETNASVYEWSVAEELTVYDVPAAPSQTPYTPAPPTNMSLTSSAATALVGADGTVYPRIEVQWDTPLDGYVTQIQMQYQLVGASVWTDAGSVDVSLNLAYIAPAIAGQQYNVRIRSLRSTGATSVWVTLTGFTAGLVLSVVTQTGVGVGSLVGEAYGDGTAAIVCEPFTALYGNHSESMFPGGVVTISGLAQQTLYYVYYVDMSLTGGDVVPMATQSQMDYLGKVGYFLIDSIVTPYAATGGSSSTRYSPSSYQDQGSRTTANPASAYDGDSTSCAVVSAQAISSTAISQGLCTYQGFANVSITSTATLTVVASVGVLGTGSASIDVLVNGVDTNLLSASATTAQTSYTFTIPANTNLSTITVSVAANADYVTSDGGGTVLQAPAGDGSFPAGTTTTRGGTSSVSRVNVYEIYITS